MTINQLMNLLIDTNTELLEAYIDDPADVSVVPYYVGKVESLILILKQTLKDRDVIEGDV